MSEALVPAAAQPPAARTGSAAMALPAVIEDAKAPLFQSVDRSGRLSGRSLTRRVVLSMIKRRASAAGSAVVDVLPHVPGDGHHGVSVERGDARARPTDCRACVAEDDEAVRPDGGHGHARRDRTHRDLTERERARPGWHTRRSRCRRSGAGVGSSTPGAVVRCRRCGSGARDAQARSWSRSTARRLTGGRRCRSRASWDGGDAGRSCRRRTERSGRSASAGRHGGGRSMRPSPAPTPSSPCAAACLSGRFEDFWERRAAKRRLARPVQNFPALRPILVQNLKGK